MEVEVEEKGRITIPARIRHDLGISNGEKLVLISKNGAIILKRKKTVTVSDMKGIMGRHNVRIEDTEDVLGKE